jgi:Arc/MetJ-type ribon-helix-helix transcriptional regulator
VCATLLRMSTTTVRLDDEDEALLDLIAPEYGGRSGAIRAAVRSLAEERRRREALRSFVADWDAEFAPLDDAEIDAIAQRFGL